MENFSPNKDLIELLRLRSQQIRELPIYVQPTWEQKLLEKSSWLMKRAADELERKMENCNHELY